MYTTSNIIWLTDYECNQKQVNHMNSMAPADYFHQWGEIFHCLHFNYCGESIDVRTSEGRINRQKLFCESSEENVCLHRKDIRCFFVNEERIVIAQEEGRKQSEWSKVSIATEITSLMNDETKEKHNLFHFSVDAPVSDQCGDSHHWSDDPAINYWSGKW